MSSGWIKVHRSMIEWEWYDDMNTKCLYLHCLLRANHSDAKWRGQDIKRGQFITSLESLSKETSLTISQVRTSIKKLISTGNLASKPQAKNRILTVVGYDSYQDNSKQNDKQVASKSQASDKLVATDKKNKNKKNEKNKDLIAGAFDYVWGFYPSERRTNKKGCLAKFEKICSKFSDSDIEELTNKIAENIKGKLDKLEDVKFMPTSQTYFNQERWNDE